MAIIKKKISKEYFELISAGIKKFELRLADFAVKEGDTLLLEEWGTENGITNFKGSITTKNLGQMLKDLNVSQGMTGGTGTSTLDLYWNGSPFAWELEKLKGDLKDFYSIRINNQWRIIFKWNTGNASEVEILDYH